VPNFRVAMNDQNSSYYVTLNTMRDTKDREWQLLQIS